MNEDYLITYLKTKTSFNNPSLSKKEQIRAMMNVVLPTNFSDEFYQKQDEFLLDLLKEEKIIDVNDLSYKDNIAIIQGDITKISCDAIVNAGNNQLLGCFVPLHKCIDNAIHSYAGLQVRRDLLEKLQGKEVETSSTTVTKGYNLPAKYIFHTVGPIYTNISRNEIDLSLCYINCLNEATKLGLKNIVFCSISTGVFSYPIAKACSIAVKTVKTYLKEHNYNIKVIFDLFSDRDYQYYERELSKN